MDKGEKKLIITYNSMRKDDIQQIADNVAFLCEGIGMTSAPMLEPVNQAYHVVGGQGIYDIVEPYGIQDIIATYDPTSSVIQYTDQGIDAFAGCSTGFTYNPEYNVDTQVDGLHFSDSSTLLYSTRDGNTGAEGEIDRLRFVPISGGEDYEKMLWFDYPVKELRYNTTNITRWFMDSEV
jgi:hypothetical protein